MRTVKTPITTGTARLAGFTLTEILVVIAIIAILASVLFPLLGRMRGGLQATQAVQRIRQCGSILMQSATDHQNKIVIHVNGTSSNMHDLRLHGIVKAVTGEEQVGSYVYTPAYENLAKGTWPVWGANLDDDIENGIVWEDVKFQRGGKERKAQGLNLARCGSMASYPLLADSSNGAGVPRARFGNDNNHKFAMRYRGKGPMFLLDGSTRLVGRNELETFGITRAYVFPEDPASDPILVTATDQ